MICSRTTGEWFVCHIMILGKSGLVLK